ncbi:MAG: dockerin type I domain-containing protein [Nitrososphaerota archaeon]
MSKIKPFQTQLSMLLLYFALSFTIFNVYTKAYAATLNLTVSTNKVIYNVGETVTVNGTLTINSTPVSDGIVAVQVIDPKNYLHVIRALPIGSPTNFVIEILQVYLSDQEGNPKSSVKRGTLGYVTIIWRNNDNADHYTSITLYLYYGNNQPFLAFVPFSGTVRAGVTQNMTVSVPIPSDAPLGAAFVCSAAFSNLPSNNGYAYCPEKSSTFTITFTSSLSTTETLQTQNSSGTYSINFTTPNRGAVLGNYTVYASVSYQGQYTRKTCTFKLILVGDVDFDGKVDMTDVGLVLRAYGSKPGDPKWNPNCDFNGDGKIDMTDVGIVLRNYGNYGTY